MQLIPWRPRALTPWPDWDRMMEEFEQPFGLLAGREGRWWPAVDIDEDDKSVTIKADLPDMDRKDIDLSVENGCLTLHGERKAEKEEKGKTHRRMERSYGMFERTFALPENIDSDHISADYKNGVLLVTMPKTEVEPEKAKRTINVK